MSFELNEMYGGVEVQFHAILTTTIKGGEMLASYSGRFTTKERTSVLTEYETGMVKSWSGHCSKEKNPALLGIEPQLSSP
jgi:hypothetical protein